jgi:acetyl-CoA synthetase
VLKAKGIGKGDTATITMPMIAEAAYAMLAYARVGAVHLVVFGGLSPDSLAGRIKDCESKVLVTVEESVRGGRTIPLEANADEAVGNCAGAK